MSRIGKMPVAIPAGVEVTVAEGNLVTVKGPKGTLTQQLEPSMTIKQEGAEVLVSRPDDGKESRALHGLTRALLHNMVVGVTDGYKKTLEVNGVTTLYSPQWLPDIFLPDHKKWHNYLPYVRVQALLFPEMLFYH